MDAAWRAALLLGLLPVGCATIAGLDEDYVVGATASGASHAGGSGGVAASGGTGATAGSTGTGLGDGGATTDAGGSAAHGGSGGAGGSPGGGSPVGGGGAGATGGAGGSGGAPPTVFESCRDVLEQGYSSGSHAYAIHTPAGARQLFCDMVVDGGGWTLVGQIAGKFDNFGSWLRSDQAADNLTTAAIEPGVYSCVNAVDLAVSHAQEIRLSNSGIDRWVKWPLHPDRSLVTWWNHAAGYTTINGAPDAAVTVTAHTGTTGACFQNAYGIMPLQQHGGSYPAAPRNETGNTSPDDWCMAVGVMLQGTTGDGFSQNNNGWDAPSSEATWPNTDYNSAPVVSVWLR